MYQTVFKELKEHYHAHADAEKAVGMKKYMKNKFEYFGIKAPLRKSINSSIYKKYKFEPNEEFAKLVKTLWAAEEREFQYTAMDWMERIVRKMDAEWIVILEKLVVKKSWWDTVDWIAANGIGRLLLKFPEQRKAKCDAWIESKNIWLNRTAILHQLKHKDETDWELLQTYVLRHRGSKEFFINKAAGWALRQYYKLEPDKVYRFVEDHPELSKLTKREALKHHKF